MKYTSRSREFLSLFQPYNFYISWDFFVDIFQIYMGHIFFSENQCHFCESFPLFSVSRVRRSAVILQTQECMWLEPEDFFVILRSFFDHVIGPPGFFFIALDDRKAVIANIFFNKSIFHTKYNIPLFAESRKNPILPL